MRKKISIVLAGRNDGYGDHVPCNIPYIDRIKYTIESIFRSFSGIDYEIIFIEINPPVDSPKISLLFSYPNTRYIEISNIQYMDIIKKHKLFGVEYFYFDKSSRRKEYISYKEIARSGFCYSYFFNFVLEKYKLILGEYVLSTSIDNIFPMGIKKIIEGLQPNILYRCETQLVPFYDFNEIYFESIYNNDKTYKEIKRTPYKGAGNFLLMDYKSWRQIKGYLPFISSRLTCIDTCCMFYALFYNKSIFPIKNYSIFNIHSYDLACIRRDIGSVVNLEGISYNHFSFLQSPPYRGFRQWMNSQKYDNREKKYSISCKYRKEIERIHKLLHFYL